MKGVYTYVSWDDYSVSYNEEKRNYTVRCLDKKDALTNVKIDSIIAGGTNIGGAEIFENCSCYRQRSDDSESVYMIVKYTKGPEFLKSLRLKFTVSSKGIYLSANAPKNCIVNFSADMSWGDGGCENTYPMSSKKNIDIMRSAVGPASSSKDNMLFDRLKDNAICVEGAENVRIKYDWKKKSYVFKAQLGLPSQKSLHIYASKNLIADQFNINYTPLNRERTFNRAPVGWMTWYAVKFDACEEKVLKNATFQAENLKDYGANCIWVDWEWYHKDMTGSRSDGADTFNPDKEKYPHGLKYVADKIKEMGLVPALWLGFTVESDMNEYMKENPEIILAEDKWWCGKYFFDLSHPKYLNEFLPKALENVHKWGYEAVKYDTLPASRITNEKYHSRMYNPELTTKEAYRGMIKKTREILGEKCYMLSCSGENDADVLWGVDIFDSARIGGDIFGWKEFLKRGVKRVMRYYPLHNNVIFPDPDNVVLREEFNDIYQATSRIYFVSMLGLPITFGDEFDALDEERINLIKQSLPVLDIHPMNVYRQTKLPDVLKMVMAIEKEWESYNVLNVFNTTTQKTRAEIDLKNDVGLDEGEYIIYNYTDDKLVKITKDSFSAELDKCQSKVFSIRKKLDIPQIISTSRHISQGACEIKNVVWKPDSGTLTVQAEVIKDAEYSIVLYVPDGYTPKEELTGGEKNVCKKTISPKNTGVQTITIQFG